MIHRTAPSWQRIDAKEDEQPTKSQLVTTDGWQLALQECVSDPKILLEQLELSPSYIDAAINASQQFPLKVPQSFIARMKKGDINDPLLKQVLPIGEELQHVVGYSTDPVGEQENPTKGVIYKYHGRALLIVNSHCAINCRYCFRRHFPYADNRLSRPEWQEAIREIANNPDITEIIYSGGDPLASNDRQLQWLTEQLATIPHIKRLRIHTRLPVVIPNRITEECINWMVNHRLQTVVVLHINHANELNDAQLLEAIQRLKDAGITVFNQAVLLTGVNDTEEDQVDLCESLFSVGVIPYYLYLLDKVQGSAHFEISAHRAKLIYQGIKERLPGYMVPKLVTEVAGQTSKTAV